MKFMLMMNTPGGGPYKVAGWAKKDLEAHMAFMKDFARKLQANGELVSAQGLAGPDQARLVKAGADGEPITDGVFPVRRPARRPPTGRRSSACIRCCCA